MLYSHSGKISLKTKHTKKKSKHTLATCRHAKSLQSYRTFCNTMDFSPRGSSVHGDSPGKNTGVGCLALLQGIFPTQGSNLHLLGLLHCTESLNHQVCPHLPYDPETTFLGIYLRQMKVVLSCSVVSDSLQLPALQPARFLGPWDYPGKNTGKLCVLKSLQSCCTLCDPMNHSPPGSSVHGIQQARILEQVVLSPFRGSSQPRDHIRVFCITGELFTAETLGKPTGKLCLPKFYMQMFIIVLSVTAPKCK